MNGKINKNEIKYYEKFFYCNECLKNINNIQITSFKNIINICVIHNIKYILYLEDNNVKNIKIISFFCSK